MTHLVVLKVLIIDSGLLVLLILRDEVVHVALRLRELHLVHALAGVPEGGHVNDDEEVSIKYQWRKAFRLNMAVNCSEILLNNSCIL